MGDMAVVELNRFEPQSFEQMVQALAFAEFGTGGLVFSPGPDGGRDFTISGSIRGYDGWSGKLVLQAKFRPVLKGAASDIPWLVKQIRGEKKKIAALGDVDYYIVATNVALSGTDGNAGKGRQRTGGFSKVTKELATWKASLNLKDLDVWPAHKIARLVDRHEGVRRRYACWLTAGDVLSTLLASSDQLPVDFDQVIRRVLTAGLERDRLSRLEDAGEEMGRKLPLDATFIDLPLVENANHRSAGTAEDDDANPFTEPSAPTALVQLLERSRCSFADTLPVSAEIQGKFSNRPSNRVVLMGGPGQGKSTVTTYLLQVLRSHLLRGDASLRKREGKLHELVKRILTRAETENVVRPPPFRYPVHVNLPEYADFLTPKDGEENPPKRSIIDFLSLDFGRASNQSVRRDSIRKWLSAYPWVAVLDGLDEVTHPARRASVLAAIREFSNDVIDCHGDVLIVVTTRPQGYNHDLDTDHWDHWVLDDLRPATALRYSALLTAARHPNDISKQQESKRIFENAAKSDAIGALMKSPLQVTILNVIAASGDSLPTVRWELFSFYYVTLKRREGRKQGVGNIIGANAPHIDAIHHIAGRALHIQAAADGGASAFFTEEAFRQLVHEYLSTKGYLGEELLEKTKDLSQAALQRLVLLSAREEGRIRFDIRSLQEFMAAASLTNDIGHLRENFYEISRSAHWRHVLLIAASRCFVDRVFENFQDTILGIAEALNVDPFDFASMTGPRIALELYCDGLASEFPDARRRLAQSALSLLELGVDGFDDRITRVFSGHSRSLALSRLKTLLSEHDTVRGLAAWRAAFRLAASGDAEASQMAAECWPQVLASAPKLLEQVGDWKVGSPLSDVLSGTLDRIGPRTALQLFRVGRSRLLPNSPPLGTKIASVSVAKIRREVTARLLSPSEEDALLLTFSSVDLEKSHLGAIEALPDGGDWAALSLCKPFMKDRRPEVLAHSLREISDAGLTNSCRSFCWYIPWPLSSALAVAEAQEDCRELVDRIRSGGFGDIATWRAAEARWQRHGITEKDILSRKERDDLSSSIADVGMPLRHGLQISTTPSNTAMKLLTLAEQLPQDSPARRDVGEFAAYGMRYGAASDRLKWSASKLLVLLRDLDKWRNVSDLAGFIDAVEFASLRDNELRRWIASRMATGEFRCTLNIGQKPGNIDAVSRYIRADADSKGLIVPLATDAITSVDSLRNISQEILQPEKGDTNAIKAAKIMLIIAKARTASAEQITEVLSPPIGHSTIELVKAAAGSLSVTVAAPLTSGLLAQLRPSSTAAEELMPLLKSVLDRREISLQ